MQATFINNKGSYFGSRFVLQCHSGFARNLESSNCDPCLAGSYSNDPDSTSCSIPDFASFVFNNTAVRCPAKLNNGAACGHGLLTFLNGSWHDGLDLSLPSGKQDLGLISYDHRKDFMLGENSRFYPCPGGKGACTVDRDSGGVTCAPGSSGVLCAACMDGYTRASDGSCARCDSASRTVSFTFGLLVMAIVFLIATSVALAGPRMRTACPQLTKLEGLRTKLKLTFVFYQVVLLLGSVFDIPYDRLPGYRAFCESLSVLKFDFEFLQFGCISFSYSFHTKLYSISAIALGLELGVIVLMLLFWFLPEHSTLCSSTAKKLVTKAAGLMLVGTYFLYPSVSAIIFTTFNCNTVDGVRYLIADYNISCDDKEHETAEQWASFMIAVFAVGLPVLYMYLLVSARRSSTTEDNTMLAFFNADYKDRFFYW
jgi:hypothetical protein